MVTIGRIPRLVNSFFRPQQRFFSQPAWPHFRGLVMAMAVGLEHTVGRLNALLRGHTHRTNDREFLWRSRWNESEVPRASHRGQQCQPIPLRPSDSAEFLYAPYAPIQTHCVAARRDDVPAAMYKPDKFRRVQWTDLCRRVATGYQRIADPG